VALLAEHPAVPGRESIDGCDERWCASETGELKAVAHARAWGPDVVYVHGLEFVALERAVTAIAPSVLFEHSYSGLCISGAKTWQTTGRTCPRALGPGCLAHYFPHRCGGRSPVTMVRDYAAQRARQRLHAGYRAILVASAHMADVLALNRCRPPVHVVPLPVSQPVRSEPRLSGTPLRVVYAGRLERLKGVHLVAEAAHVAAARLGAPVDVRIAGDGPLRPILEHQSRAPRWSDVRLTLEGWRTRAERDALFSSVDVLVIPSLWPEPFGLVGLEAGRFGVPAVAFPSGGIGEWLHDDVNGRFAAVRGSAEALGEALAAVLQDQTTYGRLSAGAIAAARAASPDEHASRLEGLFAEVAA
jgi:glycosyltransferase involved in cell wall biosynthesis